MTQTERSGVFKEFKECKSGVLLTTVSIFVFFKIEGYESARKESSQAVWLRIGIMIVNDHRLLTRQQGSKTILTSSNLFGFLLSS